MPVRNSWYFFLCFLFKILDANLFLYRCYLHGMYVYRISSLSTDCAAFCECFFILWFVMTLNPFQDSSCATPILPLTALNYIQSIVCRGLSLPSALTHVQSKYGDLPSVIALPDCQSSNQNVQCHTSLEGVLSVSNHTEGKYSIINKMHILNCYIKISCISDSFNQPTLCLCPAEFGLRDCISSENLNLALVDKLAVSSCIFWNFLLDLWMDLSPLFVLRKSCVIKSKLRIGIS